MTNQDNTLSNKNKLEAEKMMFRGNRSGENRNLRLNPSNSRDAMVLFEIFGPALSKRRVRKNRAGI